ncbi:MAG: hypothetical protein ABEI57_02860, partial [Halapricum sp.]
VNSQLEHVVKPRIDDLESQSDDARADRAELRAAVEDLQNKVARLQAELESLTGLEEGQATSPDKRANDLQRIMIQRAEERGDDGEFARVQLWYREVQDLFLDLGHGEISKPDCYKAMRAVAERSGFESSTTINANGNEVETVRLDADELFRETGSSDSNSAGDASRNPTTANPPAAATDGGEPRPDTTGDRVADN